MSARFTKTTKWMRWAAAAMVVSAAMVAWSSAAQRDQDKRAPLDDPPAELLRMHDAFVRAFVDSRGFGRMRITPMMQVMQRYRIRGGISGEASDKPSGEAPLWVADVQLIGIAKHKVPLVFDASIMGFQHVDESTPPQPGPPFRGRPMTRDEQAAVDALNDGQRLVVRSEVRPDGAGLRATGPIRAMDECLACHKTKRAGDLLGALVYTLRPLPREVPAAR